MSEEPTDSFRDRVEAASLLLETIAADRAILSQLPEPERQRLHQAIAQVFNPDPVLRRRYQKDLHAAKELQLTQTLNRTGIRTLRSNPVFTTANYFPPEDQSHAEAASPQHCYVCKQKFTQLHFFYDQMCPGCAEFNFIKRTQSANLHGRVALLTGGRVKIGFQTGLKLLRAGAQLIVTTRFPRDSAHRYQQEPDFNEWSSRLEIFGLDLRHTPSVEQFCRVLLQTRSQLDFIVNNACQTVRRPPEFYQHMMEAERSARLAVAPAAVTHEASELMSSAELSQLALLPEELMAQSHLFPQGELDKDGQQVDLRGRNSWRLLLDEVSSVELIEVQLINAIAPYILNARLKPLMLRSPLPGKHIVNVSAVEGQFYRKWKTTRHPHTNMAKAALNMMTRTSATDYHASGIYMNCVDTGWVTDEDPVHIAERKTAEQRFHPPLDIVDGAARILDPIFGGHNSGTHIWGQFLKDYKPTHW